MHLFSLLKLSLTSHIAEQIKKFYWEILHRLPSDEELQSYLILLESGRIHLSDLPIAMENSEEYKILQILEKIKEGPITTNDGITMYLNPFDNAVSGYLALHKIWEPFETKIMKKFFKMDTNFIDIGAHIGYYSLLCASIATNGKIMSFEPDKENYKILLRNISANKFKNILTFNDAVSDKNGETKFYLGPPGNSGDNRFFGDGLGAELTERDIVTTSCVRLDDLLIDNKMNPSIIKMDIQGAEPLALNGMIDTIKNADRLVLFTEFWPQGIISNQHDPEEFLELLSSLEFQIYELDWKKNILKIKSNKDLVRENLRDTYPMAQTDLLCLKNIGFDIKSV